MKKRELIDAILMTGNNGNETQEETSDSGERAIRNLYEEYQL